MRKEILFEMTSPYRDAFRIRGFRFGAGEKCVAIVGTMRGDEVQQQLICSQLVNELQNIERRNLIAKDKSILVIPTCNPFSLNINHRFWAMDGTDINRMFPGYDRGETTQRIAAAVFNHIKDFKYGIQLASFYVPGEFIPHVRMLKTGYEAIDDARLFAMPYITLREPLPFDTALLNYNWQIWETHAFSIYSGHTETTDTATSRLTQDAIMRFLHAVGAVNAPCDTLAYQSIVIDESDLVNIQAHHAGILQRTRYVGEHVKPGDILATIIDPLDGSTLEEVRSTVNATIFFSHHKPLVYQNAQLFKLHPCHG